MALQVEVGVETLVAVGTLEALHAAMDLDMLI